MGRTLETWQLEESKAKSWASSGVILGTEGWRTLAIETLSRGPEG